MAFQTDDIQGQSTYEVKVSSTDTTPDYLLEKLVAGSNITITQTGTGGDETLTFASTGGGDVYLANDQTFSGNNTFNGNILGSRSDLDWSTSSFEFFRFGLDGGGTYNQLYWNQSSNNIEFKDNGGALKGLKVDKLYAGNSNEISIGNNTGANAWIDVTGDAYLGGNLTGLSFIKSGGTSAQFLKADGSVDGSTYFTSGSIIPLANGGFGQSMVRQVVSTATNNSLTPGYINLTNATTPVVNGINATGVADGQETNIYFSAATGILTNNNSSATAANRITTPTGASITIRQGAVATLRYNSTTSRWILQGIDPILSATNPVSITSAGSITMAQAGASTNGWLSAADYNTFSNKISGGALAGSVPYYSSSASPATLLANSVFGYDPNSGNFRVGVSYGDEEAVGHFKSDTAQTIPDPTNFVLSVSTFTLPTEPTNANYTELTPDIAQATISGTPVNVGSGGYNASDIVDYNVTPGYDDGVGTITWGVAVGQTTGITDGSSFDIQINLGATGSQNFTPNIWSVSRQVNAGGYNDYQQFTSASPYDSNSGWNSGADTFTVRADDFLASGVIYYNDFYGTKPAPVGNDIVSASYVSQPFTDSASGNAYKLQIDTYNGSSPYRLNWGSGTGHIATLANSVVISPSSLTAGGATLTPTTYGFLSDGSRSVDFNYFNYSPSLVIYSINPFTQSWSDPNDGQYYYFIMNSFSETNGKLVNGSAGTGVFVTPSDTVVYDNLGNPFPDSGSSSPTSTYVPTGLWESHGSSLANKAGMVSRSLDGSYSRFEFQDYLKAPLGYLEQRTSTLRIAGKSGSYLDLYNYNNEAKLYANTLNIDSNFGALTYSGTTKLGWDFYGIKINGANSGYNSGLEVQAADNTRVTASFKLVSGQTNNLTQWMDSSNALLATMNYQGLLTLTGGLTLTSSANVAVGTGAGTKIGTATTQKLGFWNVTPIVQPANTVALDTLLVNVGFRASGNVANFATTIKPRTGGTAAGSEPLQFTSASLLTTATVGTLEFLTDKYYATITTSAVRKELALVDSAMTTGQVVTTTTNGRIQSVATLGVGLGGTNIASYAVGDLLYASGTTTLSKLAGVATGNALISGGVTTAPSWGKIGLTTHVSGTLPVANGGTGQTTPVVQAGRFSGTGTATTVFTVTIGTTQANNTYKVCIEPTNLLSTAVQYVTNKTTTTFDVTYLAGLTGTVTFDWALFT